MTMKYRRLDADGDYVLGQGAQNFYNNLEACAQAVKTRLDLYKGEFWRDLEDGVPMFQSILASSAAENRLTVIDTILKDRIAKTPSVTLITFFSREMDRDTRQYSMTASIQTEFSSTPINYQGII